jgi:hypothetical protein
MALLLAFAGYVGAWVDHKAAGLVITGLDLGEYVKFLTPVRRGEVTLWREGFYLPLVAVSLGASLLAFRAELRYAWPVRALLLALAGVAALNLLPPAWTPARMMTDEFRQQALALIGCLAALAFSPLLALLPRKVTAVLIAVLERCCGDRAGAPIFRRAARHRGALQPATDARVGAGSLRSKPVGAGRWGGVVWLAEATVGVDLRYNASERCQS